MNHERLLNYILWLSLIVHGFEFLIFRLKPVLIELFKLRDEIVKRW